MSKKNKGSKEKMYESEGRLYGVAAGFRIGAIITMLTVVMAILPTLSGYQENAMAAVKKCETTEATSGSAIAEEKKILRVSYTKFIIRSSNGKYAKVENGKVVEGDFGISYFAIDNYYQEPMYEYYIDSISGEEQYTIEPLEMSEQNYQTQFRRQDAKDSFSFCFYAESDKPVRVIIHSDGTGKTEAVNSQKAQQEIRFSEMGEKACYTTSVSGQSIGFDISKREQLYAVSSAEETMVDIGFVGFLGSSNFANIKLASEQVVIKEDEYACTISDLAGTVLAQNEMAYNVYFISDVETNTVAENMIVYKKSMIPMPKAITKEGYELEGWYTTPTYEEGTKWDLFKDYVTKETYLYAKWTKKETTKTITKPAKVKSVNVKNNSKKTVKISWKKVSKASGYEIIYSTNKSFKNATVKKVTTSANSKTIKNLKKGKTYYFKVRAYKKNGKDKITGAYSTVKKVKIKS